MSSYPFTLLILEGSCFKSIVVVAALAHSAVLFAQAPAPAITWYGSAQYRLRGDIESNTKAHDTMEQGTTYVNRIGYKVGAKVKANDQTSLQFEIGNDWVSTDDVTGIPGNFLSKRDPMTPYFTLAYVQYDPGYCHVVVGIIPVKGSALMDLLGSSIINNKSYSTASFNPWGVITNYSQTGLRVGAPILKEDFKLGVELMSATIEHRTIGYGINQMNLNAPAIEYLVEAPMGYKAWTTTPQVFIIPNRSYNKTTRKSDLEVGVGIDVGHKCSDAMTVRGGIGYAQNSNNNSYVGDAAVTHSEHAGLNATVGATVKLGPGKLDADLSYCKEKDNVSSTSPLNAWYPYFDVKYGYALNKNFIVMPRLRGFFTSYETPGTYRAKMKIRPELIFTGSF